MIQAGMLKCCSDDFFFWLTSILVVYYIMHQIITNEYKMQHPHLVITDAICNNLLQNVAKFITYCIQEFYYKMEIYYIIT